MSNNNTKIAKKGEFIFKEGDKISSLILLQSGSTSLCLAKPKKNIDLFTLSSSHVLGEQSLTGAQTQNFSLLATSEVKYLEIPTDVAKAQIETSPHFIKVLIKSLSDRLKSALNEIKSSRMEKDSSPCPDDQVAKVFGSLYHAASKKAVSDNNKNPKELTADWVQLKQYAQRIFAESPKRLEQACQILVKLKLARFEMGKPIDNPDGADEIQKIIFFDLPVVESFFEFYQYYYFKGGASLILKYDEVANNLLNNFLKMASPLPPDRNGIVSISFPEAVEFFKSEFAVNLNSSHFTTLENKGLFAKRQAKSDGNIMLSFELKEWLTTQKIWSIIREVDKWNEKGFVDMNETESKANKKESACQCPSCHVEVASSAKFCQECGAKIDLAGKNNKVA